MTIFFVKKFNITVEASNASEALRIAESRGKSGVKKTKSKSGKKSDK